MSLKATPYLLSMTVVALSGCMTGTTKEVPEANNQSINYASSIESRSDEDATLRHLVSATRDIQRQWGQVNRLTELRSGNTSPVLELSRTEPTLRRVFSYPGGYQGTLEMLVQSIASTSGYKYLAPVGRKPIRGVDVIFGEEMRTLAEYLHDAGLQSGDRADLVIDMRSQTLQIEYTGY